MRSTWWLVVAMLAATACGDDAECDLSPFAAGDPDGHPEPLKSGSLEARAGRVHAGDLPVVRSKLETWREGDFVIANDKIALVIEDVGDSELYDPWGGRPVGLARIENGRMVAPNNFGELFLLTGRSTIITDSVSVINDGSNGEPAVIRARGKLHPLPFFESLIAVVYNDPLTDIEAAIDYELAPGADHVDVRYRYVSARAEAKDIPSTLHALMYTDRTPAFQPVRGFDKAISQAPFLALVDDAATSWAYIPGEGVLSSPIAASGFLGSFTPGFTMPACGQMERLHAKIAIGQGLDGAIVAAASARGETLREITGTVTRTGVLIPNAHVHAHDGAGTYFTRGLTDDRGGFTIHVPAGANVTLDAFRRGDAIGTVQLGTSATLAPIDLPAVGSIVVAATNGVTPLPVRVQVLPAGATVLPELPANFGEAPMVGGRLQVAYATTGSVTLTAPPGRWEVIVSRGYEYDIVRQTIDVTAGAITRVDAVLDRVIDTAGVQCGDFHIHTWRSNDSADETEQKLAQAVADGVEIPVRSDHEYVADFAGEIAALGLEAYAAGFASVELTSMEIWGHMGVFPLTPLPDQVNAGTPKWQTFPTAESPDTEFRTLDPTEVFDAVRARPEAPVVIINHPRGPKEYFGYVGFDPATGTADFEGSWDTKFTLLEVFNDSGWQQNRAGTVTDWFGLLKAGRKIFAIGSSDSHQMASSPVGFPRTCIELGTDDPRQLTGNLVRDRLAAGRATVSGGIYVAAKIGQSGPGATTTGAGSPMIVDVTVQAATWIDVDAIDVIVDGETVDTIPVVPADADPGNPAVRWRGAIPVQVRATGGFVVIAAYAQRALTPVHPGRIPFGVTNPIFVAP
ncbi:MAG: CehA/McbA family metallohydrolase [Deltaproteobacteria bacterium]|nr:CehA/McbA family metallohydrolase [Deltaproteobacteria bacterium]